MENEKPLSMFLTTDISFLRQLELLLAINNLYSSLGGDGLLVSETECLEGITEAESEYDIHKGTEFENKTTYGARLGESATDILITELVKTNRFIVVERDKMDKLLEEQKLGLTGVIDPNTAAKAGKSQNQKWKKQVLDFVMY